MTSQNALKLPKNYIQTNGWIKPEYGGVGNSSGMMDLYKKRRGGEIEGWGKWMASEVPL